jgi:hypothetical protein
MDERGQKGSLQNWIAACGVLVTAEYFLFRDNFNQFFGPDAIFCMYLRFHSVGQFLSSLVNLDVAHWYRPLSNRTIPAIFFPLFGFKPFGYHIVMFALFAFMTCVVFVFITRVTGRQLAGFLGAFYFGLHSNNVYTTFDFAFAPDLLYGLFYVCAVWSFMEFTARDDNRYRWASAGLFVLSLMSKEAAVTLPGVLLLYYWIFVRRRVQAALLAIWPHLVTLGIYGIYIVGYLKVGGGDYMLVPLRIPVNSLTALYYAFNLRGSGWAIHHGGASPWVLRFFIAFAILELALIGWLLLTRDRKILLFGLGWFFIAATPILMLNAGIGPYYVFVPMIGFSMAIGASLSRPASKTSGAAFVCVLLVLLWLSCRTVVVNDMLGDTALGYGARWASNSVNDALATYPKLEPGTNIYIYNDDVPDLWRYHAHGNLFKLAYNDETITTTYRSLGATPTAGQGRLVVFKAEGEHLLDVTDEFHKNPEQFERKILESAFEYEPQPRFALQVEPAEVTAGTDFYWLSIPGLKDENVTIQYTIDKGPLAEFIVRLNPSGKVRFFVSAMTPLGNYEFLRFKSESMARWVKSNARLLVRKGQ